ncbi:MAG: iron-containing alcohol dehydrogenase [Clostridia bacterium]
MIDCHKLSKYSIDELVSQSFDCVCGKNHKLSVEKIFCSFGATENLPSCIDEKLPVGKLLVVTADDIFKSIAQPLIDSLKKDGREIEVFCYEKNSEPSVKNASRLFSNSEDFRLVLSIGSGTVTEMAKYFASVRKIPVIAVATAFSSCSYLTSSTEIIVDKRRRYLPTASVSVLFFDLDIMAAAPKALLACGVGSVFSNYLNVFDWNVANKFTDEFYCQAIADLLVDSADMMMKATLLLQTDQNKGYLKIAQALLYSCVARALLVSDRFLMGGAHSAANVLLLLQNDDGDFKLNQGECSFLMFSKLVLIYKLFFNTKLRDNALPPDVDERYSLLVRLLNFRPVVANAMTSTTISPKTYEYIKIKLEETREFFKDGINEIDDKRDFMIELFKSVYENDDGNNIFSVPIPDIKTSIVLSTEIEPHFDTLTIMKYLGLLDGYLY